MATKDKPSATATQGGPALKHNPFAALAGTKASLPEGPAPAPEQTARKPEPANTGKSKGRVVLRRETKHRGGKAVIIVTGLAALRDFDAAAIEKLAKELKQQLGCGGTVEESGGDTQIVLQGDRPAKVAELLRARGFRVDGVTS